MIIATLYARATGDEWVYVYGALQAEGDVTDTRNLWLTSGGPLDAPEHLNMGGISTFDSLTLPQRSYAYSSVMRPAWDR